MSEKYTSENETRLLMLHWRVRRGAW